MEFVCNDGGRKISGFRGKARDCAVRAICIAMGSDYKTVHKELGGNGVSMRDMKRYMSKAGWQWIPTMGIGSGCQVHMRSEELPGGRIIVRLSGHYAAVMDGRLHDTHDCTRGGSRCVYGYWRNPGHIVQGDFELLKLGTPKTVGELRAFLSGYADAAEFGFRNQPQQSLYMIRDGENTGLVFQ